MEIRIKNRSVIIMMLISTFILFSCNIIENTDNIPDNKNAFDPIIAIPEVSAFAGDNVVLRSLVAYLIKTDGTIDIDAEYEPRVQYIFINKLTPENEAINDYTHLIKTFNGLGDYFVINISSPNTPGLRDLQNEEFIGKLFGEAKKLTDMPILLKIAPDMAIKDAVALTTMAVQKGADGIIATNTTVDYSLVKNPKDIGGLSGAVLKEKSFKIFEAIAKELYGKTTLISVGGIDSAEEAYRRIKAGASLVQILSGIVFHGPDMIMNINKGLIKLLETDGYTNITQAIGADRK